MGTFRDITDSKKAAEALAESEEKYRSLAENCQDYIMRYDREGRYIYVNSAVLKISGLEEHDFLGKTNREVGFDPLMCDFLEGTIQSVFETGEGNSVQFSWDGPEGPIILDRKAPEPLG